MATTDRVTIELYVDDQGTVRIAQASQAVQSLEAASASAGATAQQAWGNASSAVAAHLASIERLVLGYIGLRAAIWGLEKSFDVFKGGIAAVEDYKQAIISAAGFLTNMVDRSVQPDLSAAYATFKDYFAWLWKESLEADKKVAASGREIFEVAQEFAKKAVVATTREQVETIGYLTDFIKQVAPTYGEGLGARNIAQFRQEVRALFEGTVRPGNQLAMALEQIDENFKENIKNAVKQGKVLEYLESLMGGAKVATQDMANTWGSVASSLTAVWGELQRAAWGEAYGEIVKFGQEIVSTLMKGGELTAEGQGLARALAAAWEAVREQIWAAFRYLIEHPEEIRSNIESIATAAGRIAGAFASAVVEISKLINLIADLSRNPLFMTLAGAALGSRLGPYGALGGGALGLATGLGRGTSARLQEEMARQMTLAGPRVPVRGQTWGEFLASPGLQSMLDMMPEGMVIQRGPGQDWSSLASLIKKPGGAGGGGGGGGRGAEAALNRLLNMTLAWEQEIARLTGSGLEQLDAWYAKELEKIQQVEAKAGETTEAKATLDRLYQAKREKLEEDYLKWLASHSGDATRAIEAEQAELLRKYKGIKDAEVQIAAWAAREKHHKEVEAQSKLLGLYKETYSAMAGLAPFLSQQNVLKAKALELEIKLGDLQFERALEELRLAGRITKAEEDELRGLRALENQMRRLAQAREGLGIWQGMERAYIDIKRQWEKGIGGALEDALKSAPREISQTFSRGIWGAIRGEKQNIADLGMSLGEALTSKILEMGVQYLMMLAMQALGVSATLEGGAAAASATLISAGMTLSAEMIAGAQAAAAILAAANAPLLFFHSGGIIPRAHGGLSLASDERLIIAQTGEGILSRRAMARLGEANFHRLNRGEPIGGGGPVMVQVTHAPTYYYRATEADYKRDARMIVKAINQELSRAGRSLNG